MHVEQLYAPSDQVRLRATGVVAIVAFAREDQDAIIGARQAQSDLRDLLPRFVNDLRLGTAGVPGSLLPVAHLRNRNDGHRHSCNIALMSNNEQGTIV